MKPQNMSVTSDERRAFGQYSDAMVIVVGIAPPSPTPVRNRSQVNDCRPLAERRRQAGAAKQHHRYDQHRFAAVAVGERTGSECADHQAEETCGEQRSQPGDFQPPLSANSRRDEADDGRIEAVDRDDEEAEDQEQLLQTPTTAGSR